MRQNGVRRADGAAAAGRCKHALRIAHAPAGARGATGVAARYSRARRVPDAALVPRDAHTLVLDDGLNETGLVVPAWITTLFMGRKFDQSGLVLPASLTALAMGHHFNVPIALPVSLTALVMGDDFKQPIVLPASLVALTVGFWFNQPGLVLPESLRELNMNLEQHSLVQRESLTAFLDRARRRHT